MDAQTCRAQLSRLLTEESTLLFQLEQQLQREHELLVDNDVDGLEQAGKVRQQTVAGLLRLDDDRRNLCRMLGHGTDQAGLAALLRWCDPQGSLAAAHGQSAEQAQRCREQNDRNGTLVAARLKRVNGMLNMLGTTGSANTYAPSAAPRAGARPATGRVLSTTA